VSVRAWPIRWGQAPATVWWTAARK